MGRRASYAVKERGKIAFFYDHGSAPGIPGEVAWGAAPLLMELFSKDDRAEGLLDEIWCEGAVGLDLDARALTFFGGESMALHAGLQRVFLELLARTWEGFDVRWAHDGVTDVARALGLDPAPLVRAHETALDPPADVLEHSLSQSTPDTEYCLLTVLERGGARDWVCQACNGDIEPLLAVGPDLVARIPQETARLPREATLCEGAVLDPARQRVSYWYSVPQRDRAADLARLWPGWRIERHVGGYARQLAETGRSAEGLLLDRDEARAVEPDAAGPEAWILDLREEARADGRELALHPRIEGALRAPADAGRRSAVVEAWLAAMPPPRAKASRG